MEALETNFNRFEQKDWIRHYNLKQQIDFNGILDEYNATILFIIEKLEETTFQFSQFFYLV